MRPEPFLPQDTMHRSESVSEMKNNEMHKQLHDAAASMARFQKEEEAKTTEQVQEQEAGEGVDADGKQERQKQEQEAKEGKEQGVSTQQRPKHFFGGDYIDHLA
jgi:Ni/Co efflux regulator RcnB